jgi:mRNA interferase HicA
MKYRDAVRRLKVLGCQEIPRHGSGSHRIWYNPAANRLVLLPDWGSKDLKIGTLRAVIRQLGLEWTDFLGRDNQG